MSSDLLPVLAALSSNQQMALMVVGIGVCVPIILGVVGICAGTWARVHTSQLETALKQQMIERGMTVEEIAAVVRGRGRSGASTDLSCASEVVVESDEEWRTALVLKRDGERYYVHFVGTEMSDNEWVPSDRVRFPAGSDNRCGSTADWSFSGGAWQTSWCGKPGATKPAPVDREI